ncbi:MAG: adenosine kinase [Bacteroidales bacterium]|nr:adenosine kinase [Bacteroidales bacterium]
MTKILGIGNALVDQLILIDNDHILSELSLPKGSMQLVDSDTSFKVGDATAHFVSSMASGGSAANTIRGLAKLGTHATFVGHVGDDAIGNFFNDDLVDSGVIPLLFRSNTPSGIAKALVTPDGERTFATYLGAAVELSTGHLNTEIFTGYDFLYIEGYLVFNSPLFLKALELAKEAGLKIALDLASYNVVEANRDLLNKVISEYVDIIFANEEEAKALTGLEPNEALLKLAEKCEYAIVKIGARGSIIAHKGDIFQIDAFPAIVADTTGAGDMYAAGFLHGLVNNWTIEKSGKTGSLLAAKVISVVGAKIDNQQWEEIRGIIHEL